MRKPGYKISIKSLITKKINYTLMMELILDGNSEHIVRM